MKNIAVFDLDGTISLHAHRLHHIQQEVPNWDAYYSACGLDEVNYPVVKVLRRLADDMEIYIATGRRDSDAKITKDWLAKHNIPYTTLITRKNGDFTSNDDLKRSWVEDGIIPADRVLCVFEDLSKSVKMWRSLGFTTFQVADDL